MVKLRLSRTGRSALQSNPHTQGGFSALLVRMRDRLSGYVVELTEADLLRLQDYCESTYYFEDGYQARAILDDAGIIA
jgi:hypothetical protein